jgi:Mg-chelatase subunit ChlD
MRWLSVAFDEPWYLLLLGLLPVVWWISRRSLAGMSRTRRWVALAARSLVVVLIVLALADVQLVRITERIATYFLLDQSLSLTHSQRTSALDYANAAVRAHRDSRAGDMAGVVIFGREALVESPLYDGPLLSRDIETRVDSEHTNLASALRLASAAFPDGVARRVVVVSDGNQNLGDALAEARILTERGIGIDVVPVPTLPRSDVIVDKVIAPVEARSSAPFDVSVVLQNVAPELVTDRPVAGRLTVVRKSGDFEQLIAEQDVVVPPGKQVLTFREKLEEPAFYRYEARFTPTNPDDDRVLQNNSATSFTNLQGRGRVLLVVNGETPHEFDHLASRLQENELQVTVQSTDALFTSLAELQQFDTVVLANVPRTTGQAAEQLTEFSDEQVEMLVRNTEQLGAGLVMLGGPDSFGAGGWANTRLEEAMPVDFRVKNQEVQAVGALLLVIDRSGSMSGEKLEMSKMAARAALSMLGAYDQIGVIAFDTQATEVVKLQRIGADRQRIQARISRITSDGGTNMEPAMRQGYTALRNCKASVKHMIVLTDGQTFGANFERMASDERQRNITTTAIAVGPDADRQLLRNIALRGGGKYYEVTNPKAIPRVFTRETRRVLRPLIHEDPSGITPQTVGFHELLAGVGDFPPFKGYVLTTPKDNPLVEVPIIATKPNNEHNPVLATWTFGLGRSAVLTTDAGQRWATAWPEWSSYDKLFVQLVRWSMRPTAERRSFEIAANVSEGRLQVVATGIDAEGSFVNGADLSGIVVTDDAKHVTPLKFKQIAPGRYQAEQELSETGAYLIAVQPGVGEAPVRVGVNVPYSREYLDREANENLLLSLSQLAPAGGQPGELIRLPDDPTAWREFPGANIFRRDLPRGRLLTSIWPLVLLCASGLFFLDVLNRRVLWSAPAHWPLVQQWLPASWRAVRTAPPTNARLQARRPLPLGGAGVEPVGTTRQAPQIQRNQPAPTHAPEAPVEEDSYAQRLLRAKRAAQPKKPRDAAE